MMAFTPSNEKTIRDVIGDLNGLPPLLQRAFASDAEAFQAIPQPNPNDWLAVHPEPGQTFAQFKASRSNRPTQDRHVIYLQPLGDFEPGRSPSIVALVISPLAAFISRSHAPISLSSVCVSRVDGRSAPLPVAISWL